MTRIVTFLKATENKEAVQLYLMAKDMFPGDPPFSFHHTTIKKPKAEGSDPTDGATEEEEDNSEESESLDSKLILEGLRKLFVGELPVYEILLYQYMYLIRLGIVKL